jgi:hypothetical protein
MLNCHNALNLAVEDPSDQNISDLYDIGFNYTYNPAEAIDCIDAHRRMLALGEYLFERERYLQSYNIFNLSLCYLSITDWQANLAAIKFASRTAMFIDPTFGMAQVMLMGAFMNTLKPCPMLALPSFLDDLFATAEYYRKLDLPDPENRYKSTAIMLFKLTIKFGKNTSFEKLPQAKKISYSLAMQTLQAKIKTDPWDIPASRAVPATTNASSDLPVSQPQIERRLGI